MESDAKGIWKVAYAVARVLLLEVIKKKWSIR